MLIRHCNFFFSLESTNIKHIAIDSNIALQSNSDDHMNIFHIQWLAYLLVVFTYLLFNFYLVLFLQHTNAQLMSSTECWLFSVVKHLLWTIFLFCSSSIGVVEHMHFDVLLLHESHIFLWPNEHFNGLFPPQHQLHHTKPNPISKMLFSFRLLEKCVMTNFENCCCNAKRDLHEHACSC